jgi:hypothetical protein
MGIQILWDDAEKTTLRYNFDEQWSWEDFFAAKKEANALIDTVTHRVGVIMSAPSGMKLPANMLTNARNALRTKHPNTVILVFVLTNPFIRTMIRALKGLPMPVATTIELASTLDEARDLVQKRLEYMKNFTMAEY